MSKLDKDKAIRKFKYLFEYKVNETPSFNFQEKKFDDDSFPSLEEADADPTDGAPVPTEEPKSEQPVAEKPATEVPPTPAPESAPATPEVPVAQTPEQPVATAQSQPGTEMNDLVQKMDVFISSLLPLSQKLDALDSRMNGIDTNMSQKMDNIEKDVHDIKQPSPEQLYQMSSLNSPPFNIRLDKYWNEKYGKDVVGIQGEQKPEEPKELSVNTDQIPSMSDGEFKQNMNNL